MCSTGVLTLLSDIVQNQVTTILKIEKLKIKIWKTGKNAFMFGASSCEGIAWHLAQESEISLWPQFEIKCFLKVINFWGAFVILAMDVDALWQ